MVCCTKNLYFVRLRSAAISAWDEVVGVNPFIEPALYKYFAHCLQMLSSTHSEGFEEVARPATHGSSAVGQQACAQRAHLLVTCTICVADSAQ
jgi:hypothetical protein